MDLSTVEDTDGAAGRRKAKRKRIDRTTGPDQAPDTAEERERARGKKAKKKGRGPAVDEADVEKTLQETLRELEMGASRARQKRRRARRDERAAERERETERKREEEGVLRVTEFVSTGELANLMNVGVNEVIGKLFSSGMMVSINQRLDADTITIVADEFGYEVEFISDFTETDVIIEEDDPEELKPRAPVVTVMGHVDHGKTSLLDYIRKANVVAGEAGGITQHIGAYNVEISEGRQITFLDTPGHEAFTAMRARGAQVTDLVILVVAADDAVMPQTIEAINHARAAEVPIVVAVNKIDKPDTNIDRVQQQLADHGVLVEQYGGKVQCAFVSAKTGAGIPDLLEKVVLESEMLNLKANPDRNAVCVVIESRLERGRGTVATVLVQNGTLRVGDAFIAGVYSGRVRAMFDERDRRIDEVGPARPALVTGLDGAPEVGDTFIVVDDEREAREIAQKRHQIMREQTMRQRKHITLDEIGRRLALGDFQELNLIVKADVGGSVEAVADSLLKLSTEEVAVNIVHKGVGAINESDVMLASASDAIIIGFQVRPQPSARALAEAEEIDIRLYSVIYSAIEEVRDALEGLLSPEKSENILGVAEVRETFKVPKVGTVAGCYVTEGKIRRNDRVHLIRDGVVIYEGSLASLKRFKDDAREVVSGYECGMSIENFNDIKVDDQIEAFEIVEKKRKLQT
jgi:translation initiation factor IF-2